MSILSGLLVATSLMYASLSFGIAPTPPTECGISAGLMTIQQRIDDCANAKQSDTVIIKGNILPYELRHQGGIVHPHPPNVVVGVDTITGNFLQYQTIKSKFALVTRIQTIDGGFKEVRLDKATVDIPKSKTDPATEVRQRVYWGDRLPESMHYYDAEKACKDSSRPEMGGGLLVGLDWRLPTICEYRDAQHDAYHHDGDPAFDKHALSEVLANMFLNSESDWWPWNWMLYESWSGSYTKIGGDVKDYAWKFTGFSKILDPSLPVPDGSIYDVRNKGVRNLNYPTYVRCVASIPGVAVASCPDR